MPVVKPEYTLTDKDLTEMESQTRAALQDLTDLAPTLKTGKKAALPGIKAGMRLLDMFASIRQSYAKAAPPDPAEELAELEKQLRRNLEFQEINKMNPKLNMAARRSVEEGIERIQKRIAELWVETGREPEPETEAVAF